MKKSAWIDFLICLFLGGYGVHKFRERKIGLGLLYLFTGGLFTFGWLYDTVVYLHTAIRSSGSNPDVEAEDERPKAKKFGWIAIVAWIVILIIAIGGCSSDDGTAPPPVDDSSAIVDQNTTSKGETELDADDEISIDDLLNDGSDANEDRVDAPEQNEEESEPSNTGTNIGMNTESNTGASTGTNVETPAQTHTHSFSAATCVAAKACSCGATEGAPLGHNWKEATYTAPKTCLECGVTEGSVLDVPGKEKYHGQVYTGGSSSKKYHYEANCAGKNSHEITWEEVERRGLGPCGTCVLK